MNIFLIVSIGLELCKLSARIKKNRLDSKKVEEEFKC